MGQVSSPATGTGIVVLPIDKETGPGAGGGTTGNRSIFLGLNAGLNSPLSNLVIIGNSSFDNGDATAGHAGTTVVGVANLQSVTALQGARADQAFTILGNANAPLLQTGDSSVIIGQGNMPIATLAGAGLGTSVIIGNNNLATLVGGGGTVLDNIIIGYGSMGSYAGSAPGSDIVAIGAGVAPSATGSISSGIFIGGGSGNGLTQGVNNICLGQGTAIAGQAGTALLIGTAASITVTATTGTIVIGANATTSSSSGITIGAGANGTANNNSCVIETNIAAQHYTAFFCQMGNAGSTAAVGNVILGQDTARNLGGAPGTNMVKIPNGTIAGGANITGGGYFYVSGGNLHWVDSAGNDSTLSFGTGQIGSVTTTALTNNAAANAGTITNAPAVGNPTKWAPFNDAGTIRNIPMW